MSTQVRLRGGTTSQHSTFTGAEREVTVDTDKNTLVVHDGTTAGGVPIAKASDKADLAGDATQAFSASTLNATTVDATTIVKPIKIMAPITYNFPFKNPSIAGAK